MTRVAQQTIWTRTGLVLLAVLSMCATRAEAQQTQPKGEPEQRATSRQARPEHPLAPAIRLAKESLASAQKLGNYQAELIKKEAFGRRMVTQKMRIKVRHQPFSVYLFYHEPAKGREVIFVEGKNAGNLLAHETGFSAMLGTLKLRPTSSTAMSDNKYPITKIGIEKMTDVVIKQWEMESRYLGTEVKFFKNAKIGELACLAIETTHEKPTRQFKYKTTRLWIDKKTNLPIRVEQFGFPRDARAKAPLVEQYTYLRLRPNVGLTDVDFSEDNPKYRF